MLIIIFAIILIVFWVLALRLTPERYPQVDPAALSLFRLRKLQLYRRYAALLVIWIIIAVVNGIIVNVADHHASRFWGIAAWSIVGLTLVYVVILLIYVLRNALQTYRQGQAIGVHKR